MAGFSTYGSNLILNWAMSNNAIIRPTSWYLALYTVAPTDAGGGTEVSGAGYTRKAISFATASSAQMLSDVSVSFLATGGDFGEIVYTGIFDAVSSGNFIWSGPMTVNRTVIDGQTLTFATGDIALVIT